ncbi:hypothetical protein QQF64_007517 [Cirrhinus molitorella]|uniref:Tripartite motif-containing protein 16 n=1 Tax=Cirrhinus molitorella TaxID=172907 RepID=A0ABR3MAY1_9TELE
MSVYSCPQCRQTFSPRPALARNTMLAEVVEKLKKTKLPADCYAGAGDVQCDVCTGRKYKAVKSCLVCLNSYCQNHLEQHESFFKGKKHNLTDATGRLQEMICQEHEKILEVFCRTDQKCICVLCTIIEHKNHDIVSAAAQRTEKQKQLKEMQKTFQQRIQQREKDVQQLREAVESHKRSAQTAVEDSERIFTELIRSIERSRSELIQLIRDQEKAAVSRAEGRLERLEQEINDLRRRDAELEQLSHTQDHIQFLQCFQSLSAPPESTDSNDDLFSSLVSFDGLSESVHHLREKLKGFCKEELKKISDRATFTNIVPRTRKDFLQYSHQLTLDLNTVNKCLSLSENNRVITSTGTDQSYPDHPDRFDVYHQVLCRESVCGRCYWEIKWSGRGVRISVSYKSISRKGQSFECGFGSNDQSWSLDCSPSRYSFVHNNIRTNLPVKSIISRIGVFVDHSAGTLSFYSVSDTMSLIHTEQTTFTQPLYPGFWSFQSLSVPPESTDVNDDAFSSLFSFDGLRESVHQLKDKLEDFCKEELKKISDRVTFTNIVPRTRKDFLQYSHQLTLDLNTVNKDLLLSENNRVITFTGTDQLYPDHPDRFDDTWQVLCRESVWGRCYWEIEWSGDISVFISVSYKSISRKGGYEKMEEDKISVNKKEFLCAVCLDLLKDPVTTSCGHSYCKSCITGCWDQEDQMRVYSCPQCRQTFSPRPALARNTMLAEVVEKLKTTKLPADCYAGAGDVQCDVCTGRKYKAVKSCLVCQESYCQTHFDRHEEFHSRKPHKVTDATGRLQEMICQKHEKILEVYCRTDQKCICVLCTIIEHKKHDIVSAAEQRTEKQKQLKETQKMFQQRIQQREKDVQQLREAVESQKRSAQTAVEDSERIFTELIRSIERSRSELIRLIRDQEKAAVSRAEGRLERLEQEINDLRRRDAELEQLSHTQDHIQFLQKMQKTFQQRIQQREKDVQQLREAVESHKRSAQTAVEDSERIFTELIRSIERSRSELIRLIRDQEKAAVSRAEGRLERLEQEINDLRRRDAELEQLSHTQDHIQFLQGRSGTLKSTGNILTAPAHYQPTTSPTKSLNHNHLTYINLTQRKHLSLSVRLTKQQSSFTSSTHFPFPGDFAAPFYIN